MPVHNDRVYPPALSLEPADLKRKRTVPLGVNSKSMERKKVVLFLASEQFKGVQCTTTYVALLQGQSKWKKAARETKTMEYGCTSMVPCTHNS